MCIWTFWASLKWYHQIKTFVLANGGKVSEIDPSTFTWHENNSLIGVFIVHVDDFLFAGNEKFQKTDIANLRQTSDKEKSKYLGLNLCYQEDKITIDQKEYTRNVECVNIEHHLKDNLSGPLSNDMKDILRQEVCQLLWVCNQSRPDICFDVSNIASTNKNATIKQLIDVNKTTNKTKWLKSYDLKFQLIEKQSKFGVYVDAAFVKKHILFSLSIQLKNLI